LQNKNQNLLITDCTSASNIVAYILLQTCSNFKRELGLHSGVPIVGMWGECPLPLVISLLSRIRVLCTLLSDAWKQLFCVFLPSSSVFHQELSSLIQVTLLCPQADISIFGFRQKSSNGIFLLCILPCTLTEHECDGAF
jgi:hypothetical protein